MDTFTLTTAQLIDIIDDAFALGKTYATDELATISPISTDKVPVCRGRGAWHEFIESNGGHTLHSGDAKGSLLFNNLNQFLHDRFVSTLDFD